MKLQSFRRLRREDFKKEDQELIDTFASSYNINIETLYQALSNRLTPAENLAATVRDVTISVNASGLPTTAASIKLDIPGTVNTVLVGRVQNLTNTTTYPTSGVTVSFTQLENNIRIDHITGLLAGNSYKIRLLALND